MNQLLNNIGAVYKAIYIGEPFGYANYHIIWKYEEPLLITDGLYVLLLNFSR